MKQDVKGLIIQSDEELESARTSWITHDGGLHYSSVREIRAELADMLIAGILTIPFGTSSNRETQPCSK